MHATLEGMAKKKSAEPDQPVKKPSEKRSTETVRVEEDLARKLTMISIRKGLPVSDLLSPQIRSWVEQLYRETVKEMHDEIDDE